MIRLKNVKKGVALFCLIVSVFFIKLFFNPHSKTIFPGEINTFVYSDTTFPEGKSEITSFKKTDELIKFSFVLRQGYSFPYAGFAIVLKDSLGGFSDFSDFDYLSFNFSEKSPSTDVRVYIKSYVENFTDTLCYMTYRFFEYETSSRSNLIPLHDFSTPQWWYDHNKKTHLDFGKEDFKNIYSVEFARSSLNQLNTPITYLIEEIKLVQKRSAWHVAVSALSLVASLFLILKKEGKLKIVDDSKAYKKLAVKNYGDESWEAISSHLQQNFSESNIGLETVSNSIGIGSSKIGRLIREKTGMNFREYLNSLRIEKAKNMLKENSNMQIIETAYAAGFSDISHFNRTFKRLTGNTPKQFKKNCL